MKQDNKLQYHSLINRVNKSSFLFVICLFYFFVYPLFFLGFSELHFKRNRNLQRNLISVNFKKCSAQIDKLTPFWWIWVVKLVQIRKIRPTCTCEQHAKRKDIKRFLRSLLFYIRRFRRSVHGRSTSRVLAVGNTKNSKLLFEMTRYRSCHGIKFID